MGRSCNCILHGSMKDCMMRKLWYCIVLVLLLFMPAQVLTHAAVAESSSNWNSMLYPSVSAETSVEVSQTISGTSNVNLPIQGCPSGSYNWDYQDNLLQDPALDNSWIQQVMEVSQSGNSCYIVLFFPDTKTNPGLSYYAAWGIPSNFLYQAPSNINFWMSVSGTNPFTVTAFYASACCSNGNTITWVIYPSQLYNSNGVQLSSPVQINFNSREDFNIVGARTEFTVHGTIIGDATFTSGAGQISYSSYNNVGLIWAETGEQSNMLYSSLTQNECGTGNLNCFYQSFSPGTTPAPSLAVQTVNQNGATITGYYVGLYNIGGTLINSGFSPVTFTDISAGSSYYVAPDNYGSCTFNYWQDTGNSTRERYFIAYGTQSLTAVYDCSSGGSGSITVNTVDQNNNPITGYFVGIYDTNHNLLYSGYSPATFNQLTIGTNYYVEPDSYGSCTFNHWQDTGSTTRDRSFTAASTQTFVAVYDCT